MVSERVDIFEKYIFFPLTLSPNAPQKEHGKTLKTRVCPERSGGTVATPFTRSGKGVAGALGFKVCTCIFVEVKESVRMKNIPSRGS